MAFCTIIALLRMPLRHQKKHLYETNIKTEHLEIVPRTHNKDKIYSSEKEHNLYRYCVNWTIWAISNDKIRNEQWKGRTDTFRWCDYCSQNGSKKDEYNI